MTFEQLKAILPWAVESEWHQHENGGGWVQNTATVDKAAFIGLGAQVYGNARVSGSARVYGSAWVYGSARVSGNALVYGSAHVYGSAWEFPPLYIQASVHPISVSSRTEVSIGCKHHTIGWWLEHYTEVGAEEKYTTAQIAEYGALLAAVKVWMDALPDEVPAEVTE
jgi:carbonic anhydrase/acetyltransferase-like protein (isoleucine patch superfamily)